MNDLIVVKTTTYHILITLVRSSATFHSPSTAGTVRYHIWITLVRKAATFHSRHCSVTRGR